MSNAFSQVFTSSSHPMRLKSVLILGLVFALFVGFGDIRQTSAQKKYPELQGEFFSDDASLVDLNSRRQISREMRNTLQDSKIHVVLAVIKQMSDYPDLNQDIGKFTEEVAEHWQIGEAKSKLGILVLFAINDRKFFVAKTKEMSERLTDEIKEGMMGLPVKALKQNNVSLAMKRAANVLVEMVPSFDSEKGAKNIVGANNAATKTATNRSNANRRPQTQSNLRPPTRVIRQENENKRGGGFGAGIGTLVCIGFAGFLVVASLAGVGMAAGRGFGGGGYYGGGYHGGGGGFLSGMLTGSLLGGMFGGHGHHHSEHHHHHYDSGGGGYDGGGGFDVGGGFDYGADTFGGGDFDGGSMGEW